MSLSNFFKLIYNEQIKIYIRKSTWAMYLILAILVIGIGFIEFTFGENETYEMGEQWRIELEKENEQLLKEDEEFERKLAEGSEDLPFAPDMDKYKINSFYLQEDIKPVPFGAWQFIYETEMLLSLISLFTIIIAANIISSEHRWGTIKLLLIRPISRTTILLSKYVSVLIFAVVTALFLFIFSFLTGAILFGLEPGVNPHAVVYDFANTVKGVNISEEVDYLKYASLPLETFSNYAYHMVILIMMTTLALMISTIFKNNALAIGVAIFLMFAGNSIVAFFHEYSWAKYILFANIDLSQYINDNPMLEGLSLNFSIMILLIHFIIFIGVSWLVFVKRDVTE